MIGRWLLRGAVVLVVLFLAIQLIPYGRSHSNPAARSEPAWGSREARTVAKLSAGGRQVLANGPRGAVGGGQ